MPADVILHNAKVATNGVPSFVDAVAITGARVLAAGSNDEVLRQRGPATLVIDAGGRAVIPGLNDSHLHVIRGGLNFNMELRWDGVPSLADALRMLKGQARRTPPPQWVRVWADGRSFSLPSGKCQRWRKSTQQLPTRRSLFCISMTGRCSMERRYEPVVTPRTLPIHPAAKSSATGPAIRRACSL